ncbi:hypothetical protein [Streptomyces sp. DH10]|uniref:hypothetical protein n=1 Tax=Streptomyces sp. DH10 TaxID=3040121 RepID=UPI00244126BF|nr:hypothetical protein [Streptomyces sp. DH10]MDG9710596.1 hypothetical protein [Streptomyces sp. DH10]
MDAEGGQEESLAGWSCSQTRCWVRIHAEEPAYIDGALYFACLFSLADSAEGAQ